METKRCLRFLHGDGALLGLLYGEESVVGVDARRVSVVGVSARKGSVVGVVGPRGRERETESWLVDLTTRVYRRLLRYDTIR